MSEGSKIRAGGKRATGDTELENRATQPSRNFLDFCISYQLFWIFSNHMTMFFILCFVRILCFVYHCFICAVLVLVVYSIVSCSHMGCVLFLVLHAVVGSVSICLSYCASHILLMLVSQLLVVCLF